MGRDYFGTISGRFWFAVQDSDDASNFKSDINYLGPIRIYEYLECCCFNEESDSPYCVNCYSNYDDHYEHIDEELKKHYNKGEYLIQENNFIKYNFKDDELSFVSKQLEKLEEIIGDNMINEIKKTYTINKDERGQFEYDFDYDISNCHLKIKELLARWCYGRLIEHSIKELGHCIIYCEI